MFTVHEKQEQRIREIRRALHRYPELSYQEKKTSALIAKELERLGIPYTAGLAGGTGIRAELGKGTGLCVALRADMDALPIHEETGLDFASQHSGVMHACGHDGHTAMLLGAAELLVQSTVLDEIGGRVVLLFSQRKRQVMGLRL